MDASPPQQWSLSTYPFLFFALFPAVALPVAKLSLCCRALKGTWIQNSQYNGWGSAAYSCAAAIFRIMDTDCRHCLFCTNLTIQCNRSQVALCRDGCWKNIKSCVCVCVARSLEGWRVHVGVEVAKSSENQSIFVIFDTIDWEPKHVVHILKSFSTPHLSEDGDSMTIFNLNPKTIFKIRNFCWALLSLPLPLC